MAMTKKKKEKKIEMILKLYIIIIAVANVYVSGESCTGLCRKKEHCSDPPARGHCSNDFVCCSIDRKSDQKCREYGKYVYRENYRSALTVRSFTYNVSECEIKAVPLVVGGEKAQLKEFPHMVAIGYGKHLKSVKWMCGGSLISENFVLSAAHCSQSRDSGPAKFARVGALSLNNLAELNAQDFTIVERINHPKYKPPSRYNDIALFKLSRAVKADGYSRPACLHSKPDEFDSKKAIATGWGKLGYDSDTGSSDLMKVTLDLIDYSTCNFTFSIDIGGRSLRDGIITSQFCAGKLEGGKDTCQGDSGGPIQIVKEEPYCMYSIIGITSFGKFCGFKNSPAVYTRVSRYVPWIESVVWP